MNNIKKVLYFICVIFLLFELTIFPYLILSFFVPDVNIERLILWGYMFVSWYVLADHWWNNVYSKKRKNTFFGYKVGK